MVFRNHEAESAGKSQPSVVDTVWKEELKQQDRRDYFNMFITIKNVAMTLGLVSGLALTAFGQNGTASVGQRGPSQARRPYVVLPSQSLGDLQKKLSSENKAEDLIGGEGMQTRVAVQHEKDHAAPTGELHDTSDDVYYVLDGSAMLTLGGKLDAAKEVEPGEWRGKITGGQNVEIKKGDLIVVPRGTPHERNTVGKDFTMILIKIYAQPLPAPKPKA
jgi:mannose-6-phosphate isomerase-like protein (cupin superfamily)